MEQTPRNVRRRAVVVRVASLTAALALLWALPFDWVKLGRAATLLAASLQQPRNAAAVLGAQAAEDLPADAAVTQPPNAALPTTTSPLVTAPPTTTRPSTVIPPKADGTGGKIVTRKITGDTLRDGIAWRNSSGQAVNITAALKATLSMRFAQTAEPQVLIVHTHTTEGYMLYDNGQYNAADRERTNDHSRSVCAVGAALKAALAAEGITAIHDTTVHDTPYSGAYTRSAKTVESYLKQYPSIRVVLDLHRDALTDGDNTLVKPTVTVDGKKAAQVMLIAGVLSTNALPNPHTAQNLALAAQWQQTTDKKYAGLTRPLSAVGSRYNQHLHAGYVLVEVGSEANTVEEAVYSATLLGKTLAELLRS